MPTLSNALFQRLARDYTFYPWRDWVHLHLCPPILFRGSGLAQQIIFTNGLSSLSTAILDYIEAGGKGWIVDDADALDEQREQTRASGRANPNWKPTQAGGYRYVGKERNTVAKRSLDDVAIQPHFPQTSRANQGDYERQLRRIARLNRIQDKRELTPGEKASREKAKTRASHYEFFGSTRASEEVAHGVDAPQAVLKYPKHNAALRRGDIPLDIYSRGAQLVEQTTDARLLETQLRHLVDSSMASGQQPQTPPLAIAKPLTADEFRAAADATSPLNQTLVREMTERAIQAQQKIPVEQLPVEHRLSYDEIHQLMQSQYGKASHEQYGAIADPSAQRAIWAGPGAGKTDTVKGAVMEMILNRGVKPEDIHFVSPTHSGKQVLQQGITESIGNIFPQMSTEEYQKYHYRTVEALALSQITARRGGGPSALEQILGTKDAQLLGAGKGPLENAKSVEAALAAFEDNQEEYVKSLISGQKLSKAVTAKQMIAEINRLKADQGSPAYKKILEEGKERWEKGGLSREHPHALHYAYEQALANNPKFAGLGQRQRRYDLYDAVDIWRKAGMANKGKGIVPKLGAFVGDEIQDLNLNQLRAIWANTTPETPMLFAGDPGQRMRGDIRVDERLGQLAGRSIQAHQLTANYRAPDWMAAHVRGINESPELQASGTSHSQVGMSRRVGQPVQYLLGSTMQDAHASAMARWFKEMGIDADAIRINLENDQMPFAWGNRKAREMPFIVSQKDEIKMLREALESHLSGMGLTHQEIAQIMEKGVSDAIPGSESSHIDQMHLITTQKSRSQGFELPFASATQGGQWDTAGWQREQLIKASRATEGLYYFGSDKNIGGTAFNNRFESLPGDQQLVPAGYRDVTARSARAMHETQGMSLEEMPPELSLASLDQPIGTKRSITPEQGEATWAAFLDVMDQQKAHPVIKRQAMPVVGSGSGFLAMSKAEAEHDPEEGEARTLNGYISGGSAIGVANSDSSLHPDTQLIGLANRYAEQLLQGNTDPNQQQFLPEQLDSIAQFMDAAKQSMGSIPSKLYWGEESGPDNMDLFIEDLAKQAEQADIDAGKKNDNDEGDFDLRPIGKMSRSWRDVSRFMAEMREQKGEYPMSAFLDDPHVLRDPELADVMQIQADKAEEILDTGSHHMAPYHLNHIARVARNLAMHPETFSLNPDEEKAIRARYTSIAMQAEAFAGKVPEHKNSIQLSPEELRGMPKPGESVQLSPGEFGHLQRTDPQQAEILRKVLGNKPTEKRYAETLEQAKKLYPHQKRLLKQNVARKQRYNPDLLSLDNPKAKEQIGKQLNQAAFTTVRGLDLAEGHRRGISFGYSAASPHMAEMALDAQRLETRGVRDRQNVFTTPKNIEQGIPEQSLQLGGTASLGQLQSRLEDHVTMSLEQSHQVHKLRQIVRDPRLLEKFQSHLENMPMSYISPKQLPLMLEQLRQVRSLSQIVRDPQQLEQLKGRLANHMTASEKASHIAQIQQVREAYHDPRKQEEWGHTLSQVFSLTTGNAPMYGDTKSGFSQQFNSFYGPMRTTSQSGQRTFEQVQRFQEVIDDLTTDVQKKGALNLGKVKRLLTAMQLDPQHPMFKGLHLLKAAGFKKDEQDIPLHSLLDPNNAVDILAQIPGADKKRLVEQFTRAPHKMGQEYAFHGGQVGYGQLAKPQVEVLQQLGLKPGSTVKGVLRPISKRHAVGGSETKAGYKARRLFSINELNVAKEMDNSAPLPPLYQLEVQGEQGNVSFPVRADQITSIDAAHGGNKPPALPPVAASSPELSPIAGPPNPPAQLNPIYQVLHALRNGMSKEEQENLLSMLHPDMQKQVLAMLPTVKPTRKLVEKKYPKVAKQARIIKSKKKEEKQKEKEKEKEKEKPAPSIIPPNYPRDMTSDQFMEQLAINPPAFQQEPSPEMKDQLQKAAQLPQHHMRPEEAARQEAQRPPNFVSDSSPVVGTEGELVSPSHPAGRFTSPFSLPAGVSDRQGQGPDEAASRGFVMSSPLWQSPTEGQELHTRAQQQREQAQGTRGSLWPSLPRGHFTSPFVVPPGVDPVQEQAPSRGFVMSSSLWQPTTMGEFTQTQARHIRSLHKNPVQARGMMQEPPEPDAEHLVPPPEEEIASSPPMEAPAALPVEQQALPPNNTVASREWSSKRLPIRGKARAVQSGGANLILEGGDEEANRKVMEKANSDAQRVASNHEDIFDPDIKKHLDKVDPDIGYHVGMKGISHDDLYGHIDTILDEKRHTLSPQAYQQYVQDHITHLDNARKALIEQGITFLPLTSSHLKNFKNAFELAQIASQDPYHRRVSDLEERMPRTAFAYHVPSHQATAVPPTLPSHVMDHPETEVPPEPAYLAEARAHTLTPPPEEEMVPPELMEIPPTPRPAVAQQVVPPVPSPGNRPPAEDSHVPPPDIGDQKADLAHWIHHGNANKPRVYPEPTEEQRGVYQSKHKNMLVKAGPGSGKTHTIVQKSVLESLQGGKSPRNWLFLSALHSGVGELNRTVDKVRPDLPQKHKDFQFPEAMTFASLGRKIISKGAHIDENHEQRYPLLETLSQMRENGPQEHQIFAPGVRWSGQAIHKLSAQERRSMTPEERNEIIEPEQYLANTLRPHTRAMGMPDLKPHEIKEYLKEIEKAKSNRTGDPNDPFSIAYAKGQSDLDLGRMSSDAALVLQQHQLAQQGDLEFSDFPYIARQMMSEFGMDAVPEQLQGLQGVTVDEGQDISKSELGMLGDLMHTVKSNDPRMFVGYDPMQSSRSGFGGLDPHLIEEEYTHAVGPFEQQTLRKNQRSNKGVVSLNNAFLKHSELKKVAKSPIQEAVSPNLGPPPRFHEAIHHPDMHTQMLDNMFKDAGITYGRMQENLESGQHPLEGMHFRGEEDIPEGVEVHPFLPGKIAAVFSQHRDREGFEFETQRRFQNRFQLQGKNISPAKAKEIYHQIFRTDKDIPDPRKIVTTLQAGARSQAFSRIHADVNHAGRGDVAQHLQQNYIAMSRADRDFTGDHPDLEGENHLYFTHRPMTAANQPVYEANPELLQKTPKGTWSLGRHAPDPGGPPGKLGRLRSVSSDSRNEPDTLGGVRLPKHFAEAMGTHVKDLLQQGYSPYHPYFKQMGLQDHAIQQANALGLIPKEAFKGVPESMGPRFWSRGDLASHREKLGPEQRQQVAQHLAAYPQSLVEEFAKDDEHARQFPLMRRPDPKEWLQDQADFQGKMRGIYEGNPQSPQYVVQAAGKQQYALHLAKNIPAFQAQVDAHVAAQVQASAPPLAATVAPLPSGTMASQPGPQGFTMVADSSGGKQNPNIKADQQTSPAMQRMLDAIPHLPDDDDASPTSSRHPFKNMGKTITAGIGQIFHGGKSTSTIKADEVNISGGSGAMHINIGGTPIGGIGAAPKGTGPSAPPPGGTGPMMWDAQKGGFAPRSGGINGQAIPRGGGLGPVAGDDDKKKDPSSGGFNNQFVQAGRTFARIGDEMAYIGQHMQQTADSALQEGSDYRMATLQIPRVAGAKTDSYGNVYAKMNQGNRQTEQGAANVTSQAWNGITNPSQLGSQIGTSLFGDPSNLSPTEKKKIDQEQQNLGSDFWSGQWGKIWNEMVQGTQEQKTPLAQKKDGKAAGSGTSAGGDNGTQGFYDFTDSNNPNTIGWLQKNILPMFSSTQIAQQERGYFAATNQGFSRGGVDAATDIGALASMTGLDAGSLTSQMTSITGMQHNAAGQNSQLQNLAGILNTTFKGNLSEQNVSPYLSAMDTVQGNLQGIDPTSSYQTGGKFHLTTYQPQSQIPQAAALFQMAMNAGYTSQNLPEVANMTNGLAGVGTAPDQRQQYALSQLFGANNMTASPELAQYHQQMLGYQQQSAGMQLQQKMQVSQLQIQADNAQIESDKFNIQQSSFNLQQGQASFNFGQWMQTQQYGPIGQDTSRSSYFDFERRQMAAGYDPSNADSASTFKPSQPFGLKNEEFYQGIENQRSMLVLGRSPLLADAAFQQQMKNLNEQENFYTRELALQNDQRSFDKTWGQKSLDIEAQGLEIQKKQLPNQIAQLEYDKANAALQAKYLPMQIAALQDVVTNTQQWMAGQGPVNGKNVSPMQIVEQLQNQFKADSSKGHQNTLNRIQQMGLGTTDTGMLFNMLQSNQNMSPQQMIGMFAAQGDQGLLNQLSNLNTNGATASAAQTAGQANSNLNQAGVGQNWDQLVQAMKDDKDAANNVAALMSGTTGLTKHVGDLTTALSPQATGIASLINAFGAITAFAGGGGGGLSGGAASGGAGGEMASMPPLPSHPLTLGSSGGGTGGIGIVGGDPDAEGTDVGSKNHDIRTSVQNFFADLRSKVDAKKYGSVGSGSGAITSNYGILTPHINKGFGAPMNYGMHQGVDFAASQGTPLAEFIGGKVTSASMGHPWGGEVDVAIPGGLTERYLHLSQIGVASGQSVKQGDHIGLTGGGTKQSGLGYWSSGSHLHAQIDRGNINAGMDPWPVWNKFKEKNLAQYMSASVASNVAGHAVNAALGIPVNVPGNVASWIATAMALTNVPSLWLNDLEVIAMHESGGNPNSINLWDSNAAAGHPSQGLFQTIPSTFAAHALPGHGNILNPVDNAAAAIGYIEGRYGTVFNVPGIVSMNNGGPYVGYGNGGIAMDPTVSRLAEKEPEAIIPLSKIQNVMATLHTGVGSSGTPASGGGSSISIQSLIGTAHITVNASGANGQMTDSDKDSLMTDLLGVLGDAARQLLGKI